MEAEQRYLDEPTKALTANGVKAEAVVRCSRDPKVEIVRFAREINADFVMIGTHGHKGLQDVIFDGAIDGVRHAPDVPVLTVRHPP